MNKTDKIRVLSVFGTRPDAIKMAPLVKMLESCEQTESIVCVTAQHRELLDGVLSDFKIIPDFDLDLMRPGQTVESVTCGVLTGLGAVLDKCAPDIVLVHGDTTTSFASALASFYKKLPVGHVEAGLRTWDKYSPYPEEMNRCLTGRIAELHFAPTVKNAENLRREGITEGVYVTGNTVIDALHMLVRDNYSFVSPELAELDFSGKRVITLTCHRRENAGEAFKGIFSAVRHIADEYDDVLFVYPVHPNPAVHGPAFKMLSGHRRIALVKPVDVADMHNLMDRSYLVMTDSGGLQEEAPALGKPVLVLRRETERPEAVEAGTVKIAGVSEDGVYEAAKELLENKSVYDSMANAVNPYGDGHASSRIVEALTGYFGVKCTLPASL